MLETLIDNAGDAFFPPDFVVLANGDVIIPDDNITGAGLTRLNRSTGSVTPLAGPSAAAGALEPDHLKLDADGNLYAYLTLGDNSSLVRMDPATGNVLATVTTTSNYFGSDFAVLPNKDVIVARYTGDSILFDKVNHTNGAVTTLAGPGVYDIHLNVGPDGSFFAYEDVGSVYALVRLDTNNGNILETVMADVPDFSFDFAILSSSPTVGAFTDVSVTEGNSGTKTATFTLTLSRASDQTTTVTVNTANGTATAGSDFVALTNQVVTFNPGQTSKTVTVTINGDLNFESDESFFLNLTNATNATIADPQSVGTITNDDTVGPEISIAGTTVAEGNAGTGTASFTLTLGAASAQAVSVTVNTAEGTASAGSDYVALTSQVVTFNPGETSKNILVTIIGDTAVETNETYTVNLSSPVNATLATALATGTITNDDTIGPAISVTDASIAEGNTGTNTVTFTLTLDNASVQPVTVTANTANNTATAGSDYIGIVDQVVTFNPGETSKTVVVTISGDAEVEANESFFVNLTNPTNSTLGDAQAVGTITNDDAVGPTVNIDSVSVTEGNSGTTAAVFTLTLLAPSGQPTSVTVNVTGGTANSGEDYVPVVNQVVTFQPGETTKTLTVAVVGDSVIEPVETFFVELSNPVNAVIGTGQGQGTILNDDFVATTVSIGDATVVEGNGGTVTATFTVTLNTASTFTTTVQVDVAADTATPGQDYVPLVGQFLTFAPGETQKTVSVTVNGDTLAEPDETFFVNLSNAVNTTIADGQGLGTITKDDAGPDLVVSTVSAKLPAATISGNGKKIALPLVVRNVGTLPLVKGATIQIKIYAHLAQAGADRSGDVLVGTYDKQSVSALGVNKTKKLTEAVLLPSTVATGDYRLFVVVDTGEPGSASGTGVAEVNESNNTAQTDAVKQIRVTQGVVDLRAAYGKVKFPKVITPESKATFPIIITNGGNIAFGANVTISVSIKLHPPAGPDIDVIVLQQVISKLGAGKSKTLSAKNVQFALDTLEGVSYTLTGVVDVDNVVPGESNEGNNTITSGATFTGP